LGDFEKSAAFPLAGYRAVKSFKVISEQPRQHYSFFNGTIRL
jgi:hypothetical protein